LSISINPPEQTIKYWLRFQVLTAASLIALMMEATSTSETSVNFYQTTRRNVAEDSRLNKILFANSLLTPIFWKYFGLDGCGSTCKLKEGARKLLYNMGLLSKAGP
jgi:hypothetical protein